MMLSKKDIETVINAFITSRMDYCNLLYLGLPKSALDCLQMVQNVAPSLNMSTLYTRAHLSSLVTG